MESQRIHLISCHFDPNIVHAVKFGITVRPFIHSTMDVSVIELMMFLVAAEASVSAKDVLNSLGEVPWILKRLEVSLRNGFSKLLVKRAQGFV